MPYDEQKLLHFETSILSEATQKAEEIENEISEFTSSEMEKARQDEYNKEFNFMQNRVKEIKQKYSQLITKESLDSKRELLEFRNSLVDTIFVQAKEKLKEFSESNEYENFLTNRIGKSKENFPCESATIYLRDSDMKFADKIKTVVPNAELETDKKNLLGGYKIINTEKGLLLDETFGSNLENQRRDFYEQCGLTI